MKKDRANKGFSLVEILVVLTIMMGLMAIIAGDISKIFGNNDIDQAQRVIQDAFSKARSKAMTLEREVAVYISFRSQESQPESKLWVVVGAGHDQDLYGPSMGLNLDEFDRGIPSASVTYDDSVLPISYILPHSVFVHGIQTDTAGRGKYIRWYAIFYPDGSCRMIMPDGENTAGDTPVNGLKAWNKVNDYLPEYYLKTTQTITSDHVILPQNLSTNPLTDPYELKTDPKEFEEQPQFKHDMKIYTEEEEKYFLLQIGPGKLVVSDKDK